MSNMPTQANIEDSTSIISFLEEDNEKPEKKEKENKLNKKIKCKKEFEELNQVYISIFEQKKDNADIEKTNQWQCIFCKKNVYHLHKSNCSICNEKNNYNEIVESDCFKNAVEIHRLLCKLDRNKKRILKKINNAKDHEENDGTID